MQRISTARASEAHHHDASYGKAGSHPQEADPVLKNHRPVAPRKRNDKRHKPNHDVLLVNAHCIIIGGFRLLDQLLGYRFRYKTELATGWGIRPERRQLHLLVDYVPPEHIDAAPRYVNHLSTNSMLLSLLRESHGCAALAHSGGFQPGSSRTTLAGRGRTQDRVSGALLDYHRDVIVWRDFLSSNPQVCGGEICASGTRVPVTVILDSFAEGSGRQEILHSYPSLRPEHLDAALACAAELAHQERLIPIRAK